MTIKKGWFSKITVVVCIVLNLWFTNQMIKLHIETGHTPDALIVAFFGSTTGELGYLTYIKKKKEDHYGTNH